MPKYEVTATARAYRGIKKLPEAIQERLQSEFETIAADPHKAGVKLKGKLSHFYSRHVKQQNVQYRIVYTINEQKLEVAILKAGKRENFYRDILN